MYMMTQKGYPLSKWSVYCSKTEVLNFITSSVKHYSTKNGDKPFTCNGHFTRSSTYQISLKVWSDSYIKTVSTDVLNFIILQYSLHRCSEIVC